MRKITLFDECLVLFGPIISRFFACSNEEKNKQKQQTVRPISMVVPCSADKLILWLISCILTLNGLAYCSKVPFYKKIFITLVQEINEKKLSDFFIKMSKFNFFSDEEIPRDRDCLTVLL
jgi:hypothetical protein